MIKERIERARRAAREVPAAQAMAILGALFSLLALGFGLVALVSYYIIDEGELAPDPYFAWGPFATICGFIALGVLVAARRTETLYGELALRAGVGLLGLAGLIGVIGVIQAAWNDNSTISHGIGWLSFAQPAAIVGVAWLLYADGPQRGGRT